MINLENVTIKYDNSVIENINTSIDKNKITFIIGKNGSGKSTLANVLTGLKYPTSGNIIIDKMLITKKTSIKEFRKNIGMVFQNPSNQIIFSRVYDDIKFTLENMGVSKGEIDLLIKDSLKDVSMEEYINANPYNLSLGQKQRIAIASQIALKPNYIVFDEATSMLDINGKKDIYKLIRKLKDSHCGVIFITNIMDELIYADEVLIIDDKKIFKYTKEEIFSNLDILKSHKLDVPFTLKIIDLLKKKNINAYDEKSILEAIDKL